MTTDQGERLPAPEGYEWVEVGAYTNSETLGPRSLVHPWPVDEGIAWTGTYGPQTNGCSRGDDPREPRRCAWERLYVLRPQTNPEGTQR